MFLRVLDIDRHHQSSDVKKKNGFFSLSSGKYTLPKNDRKKQQKNNCTISFLKPVFFYTLDTKQI